MDLEELLIIQILKLEMEILLEKGIEILEKFDGKCSKKLIDSFCKYIDISENEFWFQISKYVNKNLFSLSNQKNLRYKPKFKVGFGIK